MWGRVGNKIYTLGASWSPRKLVNIGGGDLVISGGDLVNSGGDLVQVWGRFGKHWGRFGVVRFGNGAKCLAFYQIYAEHVRVLVSRALCITRVLI